MSDRVGCLDSDSDWCEEEPVKFAGKGDFYRKIHTDIDWSWIQVSLSYGSVQVQLYESIWDEVRDTDHDEILDKTLTSAGTASYFREVNSDWYDGDHLLKVTAITSAEATIHFESKDN